MARVNVNLQPAAGAADDDDPDAGEGAEAEHPEAHLLVARVHVSDDKAEDSHYHCHKHVFSGKKTFIPAAENGDYRDLHLKMWFWAVLVRHTLCLKR